MFKKQSLLLALALSLAACASTGVNKGKPATHTQQIETTCVSVAGTLRAIHAASAFGKVSPAQHEVVVKALTVITPVCKDTAHPPTLTDVEYAAFQAAVAQLGGVK